MLYTENVFIWTVGTILQVFSVFWSYSLSKNKQQVHNYHWYTAPEIQSKRGPHCYIYLHYKIFYLYYKKKSIITSFRIYPSGIFLCSILLVTVCLAIGTTPTEPDEGSP